jgi:hypothetical protein
MTTDPIHASLPDRWSSFTIVEQMANIGSEVERTIRAHESGNATRFAPALDRALELFDLTATDNRWRGHRRREILRSREEFCRLFFESSYDAQSSSGLRRYFTHFAAAANRARAAATR